MRTRVSGRKDAAEKAKIELSATPRTTISLPFISADANGPKNLEYDLTRAKFDELTEGLVAKTTECVKKALADAELTNGEIDKVILVGGSTRIPAVVDAVKAFTGKEPFKGINPDECVAVGTCASVPKMSPSNSSSSWSSASSSSP